MKILSVLLLATTGCQTLDAPQPVVPTVAFPTDDCLIELELLNYCMERE